MGTILAAQQCLTCGFVVNLGGGYHHAKPESGEGFCIYSDIGIAVASLRAEGRIHDTARIVYIDTDAHQGNGVCHTFLNDSRVSIFDIYNHRIYPALDLAAHDRIDCNLGIDGQTSNAEYMGKLHQHLPGFLDSICNQPVGLAIYNAGTDVFEEDPLGGLRISASTISERDQFVVAELRKRRIPTVMVLSGGYTKQSYQLVADSVIRLFESQSVASD